MTMIKPASPLPWNLRKSIHPVDGAYDCAISSDAVPCIAETFGRSAKGDFLNSEENATYIITACNSYPDLVEALQKIKDNAALLVSGNYVLYPDDLERVLAALKKAGVE